MSVTARVITFPNALFDVVNELWGSGPLELDAKIADGLNLLIDQVPALEFSADWQAAHPLTMEYVRGRHGREHGGAK